MVVHSCNPSTWEAKARGSGVQGQPGLKSETQSQNQQQESKSQVE
jgi:hypothetical protein